MFKRTICILLAAIMILTAAGCVMIEFQPAAPAASETSPQLLTITIRDINKHGNLMLDTTFDEMNAANMEVGDLITAIVGDQEFVIPIGTAYTDVDSGEMLCRFDMEDNEVALGINYGSFADVSGAAVKQTIDEDPGYKWDVFVSEVGLVLKEKAGYLDEYNARNLTRTDAREDYPDLTDEEFANFRMVSVTGIQEGLIYRSSTPVEPAIGRNEYAMSAMEKAGIRSVLNLDDTVELMESYDTFPGSYYSNCVIANPGMSYDFMTEDFGEKIRESVLFLIENEGPFLIHCKEGKDRTGMLCAILECFAGAPADEVARDYMITYKNYYNVKQDDATYDIILNSNLVKTLCSLFHIEGFYEADLEEAAAAYLLSTGLTEEQLDTLREKIASGPAQ